MSKALYELGKVPPIGEVPQKMYAQVIRQNRFGEPRKAFKVEIVEVPDIQDNECLLLIMAAGINFNNIWAALGTPIDIIKRRETHGDTTGFHIGGSDASGIIYKTGRKVDNVKIGDEVVVHCGMWDYDDPSIKFNNDPFLSSSYQIWGYESNYGSFAQFAKVQSHQLLPKPPHLTWEASASYMLVAATAYRMLHGFTENAIREGDVVLIWGGAGGLGCQAIQLAKAAGAIPVAVVSDESKIDFCTSLGAKGVINRKDFDHWGILPHWKDKEGYNNWLRNVRKFRKSIWDAIGKRKNPKIVFEHPGENTIPTSCYVCERGGMIVICGGTTGFNATFDLRYHWMHQKRLQGSHFANNDQARAVNDLFIANKLDPCLSQTFSFKEIPDAHQLMYENQHGYGNAAALVSAQEPGLGKR